MTLPVNLDLCLCVCVHSFVWQVCACVCVHLCVLIHEYLCVCPHMSIYLHAIIWVHKHTCVIMCPHSWVHMCVCAVYVSAYFKLCERTYFSVAHVIITTTDHKEKLFSPPNKIIKMIISDHNASKFERKKH